MARNRGGGICFSGTYDGQNYAISGLKTFIDPDPDWLDDLDPEDINWAGGLFIYIQDATIKNVRLTSGTISAMDGPAAGLVAIVKGGNNTIERCSNSANIDLAVGYMPAGGIVAQVKYGASVTISECFNHGQISSWYENKDNVNHNTDGFAGGIVGYAQGGFVSSNDGVKYAGATAVIEKCVNSGDIRAGRYAGAIAGYAEAGSDGQPSASIKMTNCASFASVTASSAPSSTGSSSPGCAGIIGRNDGVTQMTACSQNGSVVGPNKANFYGSGTKPTATACYVISGSTKYCTKATNTTNYWSQYFSFVTSMHGGAPLQKAIFAIAIRTPAESEFTTYFSSWTKV